MLGGKNHQRVRFDIHYIHYRRDGHGTSTCIVPWENIEEKQEHKEDSGKTLNQSKCKSLESNHYILYH